VDVSRIQDLPLLEVRHYAQLFTAELKSRLLRMREEEKRRGGRTTGVPATPGGTQPDEDFGSLTTPEVKTRATKTGKFVEYFEYSGKLVTHEKILGPWEDFIRTHGREGEQGAYDEEDRRDATMARVEAAPEPPPAPPRPSTAAEPTPSPDADYRLPRVRRGSYKARQRDPLLGLRAVTVRGNPKIKGVRRELRASRDASLGEFHESFVASLQSPGHSDDTE
jgi:hypothetical protein